MTQRPVILFDVMETLVNEPFFTAIPAFLGMSLDQLLAAKHPTSWIEFEKGHISEAEYFASFFTDGRAVDGEGVRDCLQRSYRWIDGMEELLAELHSAGYEMHAFSNYSIWYRQIDESLNLSRFLRWTFVSCHTGVRKPDPQAYHGAASRLGTSPARCLFIDDREVNVTAAREVGMDAILKRDSAQVRADLVQRKILGSPSDRT